jgi:class 3 adenylate cyclase
LHRLSGKRFTAGFFRCYRCLTILRFGWGYRLVLAFGDHRLDIARRELRRGAELIYLPPKAFDLLAFLVQNCDRVVSKDDLVREVWGGRIISESAITTRINAVRRALGDDGTAQRFVRTFIGRGLRFVGEVRDVSEKDAPIAGDSDSLHQALLIGAERRQLTVMICEIVISTVLAARLDPEDLREVIDIYQNTVKDIVANAGGYVAESIGTDILAYFGYPRAQEHDADHAVRSALALINRISALKYRSDVLACRIGIATGLVVVGDLSSSGEAKEYAVVGEALNLAARLKASAPANAVFIAEGTRELVGDIFEYRALEGVAVEGSEVPVQVWQALRESNVKDRFVALRSATTSRLVGRDEELELLMRRWSRAQSRLGQVVLLCGEAGLGKSRLVAAFQDYLGTAERVELRYFCWPHRQDTALFPFTEQLCQISGFNDGDTPVQKLEKLRDTLSAARVSEEDVALIADLLSLHAPANPMIAGLSAQRKKERTLASLISSIQCFANMKPVLMIFEDVHWIDPSSREFLDLLIEQIRQLPVLLIISYRPEFAPPWAGQPQVSTISLNGLDRHDTAMLAKSIAGTTLLSPEIVKQIGDRTDGVPLFIEELTKTILESGLPRKGEDRGAIDGPAIPMTLRGSLLARLDHLASQRHLAQVGAAIGREFSYELLSAVSGVGDGELAAGLDRLVGSGLIFQRGNPPHAIYSFKHALVQEAAYSSLLRGLRRQLHARIAEALEVKSSDLVGNQPELFAHHYAEAGFAEKSADLWEKAARRSVERSAMAEAAAQLEKALVQLRLLPDAPERRQRELQFRVALGGALQAVKGFAAPETGLAMPERGSCGSNWGPLRNSFSFRTDNLSITCTGANSVWRSAWIRSCYT